MRNRSFAAVLLFGALLSLGGCGEEIPAEPAPGLQPGWGVRVQGMPVQLGACANSTLQALGLPEQTRTLGQGQLLSLYPRLGLEARFSSPDEGEQLLSLRLGEGFTGRTSGGLGIGSSMADFQVVYGSGSRHPFLNVLRFPESAFAVELGEGDLVQAIHLFASRSE